MTSPQFIPATISLVGMPGSGKSTVGVLLAKLTGLAFVDTDLHIQVREGATLQAITERHGYWRFREIEEQVLLAVPLQRSVISTGGSVIYSEAAIARLRAAGPVVYLEADIITLEQRVAAAPQRGIAYAPGQTFAELFAERTPLYQRQADIIVDAVTGPADVVAANILNALQQTDHSRFPDWRARDTDPGAPTDA